jgi:hypothetical protein
LRVWTGLGVLGVLWRIITDLAIVVEHTVSHWQEH